MKSLISPHIRSLAAKIKHMCFSYSQKGPKVLIVESTMCVTSADFVFYAQVSNTKKLFQQSVNQNIGR